MKKIKSTRKFPLGTPLSIFKRKDHLHNRSVRGDPWQFPQMRY